jgi:hypothetical protein
MVKGRSCRLAQRWLSLASPSRKDEQARHGEALCQSVRQLIESVNDTLKGQLDLEAHGGRTLDGVAIRVGQRILAIAAAGNWPRSRCPAPSCSPSPATPGRSSRRS